MSVLEQSQAAGNPPRPASARAGENIIKVASGKGGVGKTAFSATLAHCFAFRRENVLLFDGDLGLANVDVQLGLAPQYDLGSVIAGTVTLDDAVVPVQANAGPDGAGHGGFHVLAGKSGSGALGALSRTELARIRQGLLLLSGHYDRLIVDLAAGVDPAVTMLAAMRGTTLVVVTDEPTSLTDAYAFIKVTSMEAADTGEKPDIRIVVNMADSTESGRRTYETLSKACENFLGITPALAGIVPRDPAVPAAIRRQLPLLTRDPKAPAGAAIDKIAATLTRPRKGSATA